MKVESGFQEHFHHIIYDDFWYSLSEGSVSNKNDLHLENDEDAEKVMNAIQVLKQYQKVCEKEAEMFDDAD
jgi:hypothetical protein